MSNVLVVYRFYDMFGDMELLDTQVYAVDSETVNNHLSTDFYVDGYLFSQLIDKGEIELIRGSSRVTLTYF